MRNPLQRARFKRDHRWAPRHMSGYIDGELATSRGRRLERHVDECDECRRVLRGLERMVGRLHRIGIPAEAPDPRKLAARVRERLEERRLPNAS